MSAKEPAFQPVSRVSLARWFPGAARNVNCSKGRRDTLRASPFAGRVWRFLLRIALISMLAEGAAWGAREYDFQSDVPQPFELVDFIGDVMDDTGPDGEYVRFEWEARTRTFAAGSIPGRLTITVRGFAGDTIVSHASDPRWHMGVEPITTTGSFDVHEDEWFRARSIVIGVEPVEPQAGASGLFFRKLNVFPGSPLQRGQLVPLRWSTVITTKPGLPTHVHLFLRIWDENKYLVASYPIMQVTLAPRSRIKLSHVMIITQGEWHQADSVTVDVISR